MSKGKHRRQTTVYNAYNPRPIDVTNPVAVERGIAKHRREMRAQGIGAALFGIASGLGLGDIITPVHSEMYAGMPLSYKIVAETAGALLTAAAAFNCYSELKMVAELTAYQQPVAAPHEAIPQPAPPAAV